MRVRMTFLSVLEIVGFGMALVYYLWRIVAALERIGGEGSSYGSRVRFGVRAIEKETSLLGSSVVQLNERLARLGDQLATINRHLEGTARTLARGREAQP